MPCESSPDGNLGSFRISYLAHHDDIRILAEDGSQDPGKGKSYFGAHVGLIDSGKVILDRVFDGSDIDPRIIDVAQCCVECGGLPATRRTRDKNHAVRQV